MTTAKQATVFGGTGFIGQAVVRRLVQDGYTVRVPTRDPVAAGRLCVLGEVGQVVPVCCALSRPALVEAAVEGADVVVNLIGILHARRRGDFQRVHVEVAETIARCARVAGVRRFVHMSALGASTSSCARYACSKAAGETAVLAAFPGATVLRPSVVFGPGDRFFNRFADLTTISPVLPLIGGGRTRFQPVYVGDVADAVRAALVRTDAAGRRYELGGPDILTFRELMEKLLAVIGRRRWLVPVPWAVASVKAAFLELLPNPPLTRDQVRLLRQDCVVGAGAPDLSSLGLVPTSMDAVLPYQLRRFRSC